MRVLVTGASGFIGSYVVDRLLRLGYDVVATSKNQSKAEQQDWFGDVTYIPFNIGVSKNKDLLRIFQSPDVCIHLAWGGLSDFKDKRHENEFLNHSYDFLKTLICDGLKKVVVTGTCLEYGLVEGVLNEDDKVSPLLPYALGKNNLRVSLEELKEKNSFQLDWIRLFYMYGKGQSSKSILSQLESSIQNRDEVFNMSGGEQRRDYLSVEDIVNNIVLLSVSEKENGIVNCSSGQPIKIIELVENYLLKNQAKIKLNKGFYPYPDYEPFEFWGDNTKLKNILNEITVNR